MSQICEWCKKDYVNTRSHSKTRFCSRSCAVKRQYAHGLVAPVILARKGWKGVRNTGRTRFKKHWNGTEKDYKVLHNWVRSQLGTPDTCVNCQKTGLSGHGIHWANKSGKYLKDVEDWIRLCQDCHTKYDRI